MEETSDAPAEACVLAQEIALGNTGVDASGVVVAAGAAIAIGVLLLAIVLLRRMRRGESASDRRPGRTVVAVLAALVLLGAGGGAGAPIPAQALSDEPCSLIEWNLVSGARNASAVIDGQPTEIARVSLANRASFPIDVAFGTTVTSDTDGLAQHVDVGGTCTDCSIVVVYDDRLGAPSPGPTVRLQAGQRVVVAFTGAVASTAPSEMQSASTTYDLLAYARQAT